MSGHSKWSKIKRKKEATDAKRGQQFTKLALTIKQAAAADNNPSSNAPLNEAIKRAKQANMPQENIDRLLAKADTSNLESVTYEAFGPAGTALIIQAATDNPRRTVAEVRAILKNHQAQMGQPGSVMWKFTAADNTYTPQYPTTLDPETKDKLAALVDELNKHSDIQNVITDTI